MTAHPSILVVDDDYSGRAMLSLSLKQAGFPVQAAADGEEALRFLSERRYDWLITDAKMRPMDGFALSQAAKRIQPDLRVVMISAVYTERDAGGYPIEKFFAKPVPVDQLVDWIFRGRGTTAL